MVAENPDAELERFREAVETMHSALDAMLADSEMAGDGEHREILETYRMFAEDRGWLARIAEAIRTGLTRSEEHTSELPSLMRISYAVICLQKKKTNTDK